MFLFGFIFFFLRKSLSTQVHEERIFLSSTLSLWYICFNMDPESSAGGSVVNPDSLWVKKKRKINIYPPKHFSFPDNVT